MVQPETLFGKNASVGPNARGGRGQMETGSRQMKTKRARIAAL